MYTLIIGENLVADICIYITKRSLNSNDQQFYQHQQNEQSPPTLTH